MRTFCAESIKETSHIRLSNPMGNFTHGTIHSTMLPLHRCFHSTKTTYRLKTLTSRAIGMFPSTRLVFRLYPTPKRLLKHVYPTFGNCSMAFLLRSHNGVSLLRDSRGFSPHSQLSTATCTFTGYSLQNCGAKVQRISQTAKLLPLFFWGMSGRKALKRNLTIKIMSFSEIAVPLQTKRKN